jgi:protein SCO1/2
MTTRMAALRREAPEDVTMVSFTVDPAHDDPATLRAYAERFHADPDHWLFLTGETPAVERLVRDGFRLSMAALPAEQQADGREPITHSERFVLVDDELRIRGYYHGSDELAVAELARDFARLRR